MKKFLKRLLGFMLVLIVLLVGFLWITGRTYLLKAAWYYTADIDDYKIFDNRTVSIGKPQPWKMSDRYNKIIYPGDLDKKLVATQSIALAVIQNDSLLFEKYWDGYSDSSLSASFSIAKSITSLAIGIALKEGKIKSLDQPVADFIPEFKKGDLAKVTIRHLLTMSSGTNWDESYSDPFSLTTEIYYGSDAYKTATKVKIIKEPGTYHDYKSGDTELLGLILLKATGQKLSDFVSEKLWKPLGAEHPALWSIDHKDGYEKNYCCFNSNARDFARLGQLMLDTGRWNGVQIIDTSYWRQSITPCGIPDIDHQPCSYYGYQWWIVSNEPEIFFARGILGQFVIVIPAKKMVIVRLGKDSGGGGTNPEMVSWLVDWGKRI
jgi:CubicO group peptidase (beta-lactamase class C family)